MGSSLIVSCFAARQLLYNAKTLRTHKRNKKRASQGLLFWCKNSAFRSGGPKLATGYVNQRPNENVPELVLSMPYSKI